MTERTVTWGKWSVSVTTGGGEPATLNVRILERLAPNATTPAGATVRIGFRRGDLDGQTFATSDEAFAAARAHGYLQVYRADGEAQQRHKESVRRWRAMNGQPVSYRKDGRA